MDKNEKTWLEELRTWQRGVRSLRQVDTDTQTGPYLLYLEEDPGANTRRRWVRFCVDAPDVEVDSGLLLRADQRRVGNHMFTLSCGFPPNVEFWNETPPIGCNVNKSDERLDGWIHLDKHLGLYTDAELLELATKYFQARPD